MKRGFYYSAAVLVGLLPALFLIGPAVYADGSTGERLAVLGAAALAYGLLGAGSGYLTRAWQMGLWLSLPALLVTVALGDSAVLVVASAFTAVGASVGGAHTGVRLRAGKQK